MTGAAVELIRAIQRSQLMGEERLNELLNFARSKHRGKLPESAEQLADVLVSCGALTRWQTQQLLSGKRKGFFLGKYKLLRPLGKGGMGTVYLGEHTLLRRRAAIKVFAPHKDDNETSLKRMEAEAQTVAQLDHPHIVRAYDFDRVDPYYYFAMEYVEGTDLGKLVQDRGALPIRQALDYIRQAALGLAHAHQKGIVHRDIKPANLLLTKDNIVKVADLGLALAPREEDGSMTIEHEQVLGTADYVAPEQALDSHSVDHRADIYSLGCTLYHLITGKPPFAGGTVAQRLARHQIEMPAAIAQLRLDCPPQVAALCWKMLQKKPIDRMQTAADVVLKITQLLKSNVLNPEASSASLSSGSLGGGLSSMNLPQFPSTVQNLSSQSQWDTISSLAVSGAAFQNGSGSVMNLPQAKAQATKHNADRAFYNRLKIYVGLIFVGALMSVGILAWSWMPDKEVIKATEGGHIVTTVGKNQFIIQQAPPTAEPTPSGELAPPVGGADGLPLSVVPAPPSESIPPANVAPSNSVSERPSREVPPRESPPSREQGVSPPVAPESGPSRASPPRGFSREE